MASGFPLPADGGAVSGSARYSDGRAPRHPLHGLIDDWIILAQTRWHLRRGVRVMNRVLADLGLGAASR